MLNATAPLFCNKVSLRMFFQCKYEIDVSIDVFLFPEKIFKKCAIMVKQMI